MGLSPATFVIVTGQQRSYGIRRKIHSETNSWGFELLTDHHVPEAIDVLRLNAKNYPDSGDAYDSLGEAYMQSGQKELAIDNYKKSLEKDPSNDNAREKLKELGAPAAEPK